MVVYSPIICTYTIATHVMVWQSKLWYGMHGMGVPEQRSLAVAIALPGASFYSSQYPATNTIIIILNTIIIILNTCSEYLCW